MRRLVGGHKGERTHRHDEHVVLAVQQRGPVVLVQRLDVVLGCLAQPLLRADAVQRPSELRQSGQSESVTTLAAGAWPGLGQAGRSQGALRA